MAGSPLPFHDASVRPKSATHDAKLYCLSLPPISNTMATACTAASSPVSVSVRELNLGPLKIRRRDALRWRQARREGGRRKGATPTAAAGAALMTCRHDEAQSRTIPNRVGSRLNLGISPLSLPPSHPAFPLPSSSSKPTHAYRQSREPPARVERVGARAGAAYAI